MAGSGEIEKIRQGFALSEKSPQQVTSQELGDIANDLLLLYGAFYGTSRYMPFKEAPPDTPDPHLPRGVYFREVGYQTTPDRRGIQRVIFGNEWINFVRGDPNIVAPSNPRGVYKDVFAHELVHSQVEPNILVGSSSPPLTGKDIGYPGKLHYVIGFKAVAIDPQKQEFIKPTANLEEWVAQYLAMAMLGSFKTTDPILEQIKHHGQGIDAETIIGAEVLNKLLRRTGIQPQQVELLHRQSNLRGFMKLLDRSRHDMGKSVVKAGSETDKGKALERLQGVEARLKR